MTHDLRAAFGWQLLLGEWFGKNQKPVWTGGK